MLWRRRPSAGQPIRRVPEGDPFFFHGAVPPIGNPSGGDQAEEDADTERGVDRDTPITAVAGRIDDAEEDQQD